MRRQGETQWAVTRINRQTLALLALMLSTQVIAAENVEALFTDEDPTLHRNKQTTLHILRDLLQCNQWSRASEWITPRYIQHNPNVDSGLKGVVYYFTEILGRRPTSACEKLTMPVIAVIAEGQFVTVLRQREHDDPRNLGRTYKTTWFDTWRFVDGKADEHWDPATVATPCHR